MTHLHENKTTEMWFIFVFRDIFCKEVANPFQMLSDIVNTISLVINLSLSQMKSQ